MLIHDDGTNGVFEAIVRRKNDDNAIVELCANYQTENNSVWGIQARNREQNFAINLLMDPEIDIVTILGNAGTGKTLLTLAAGLTQVLDERRYQEIIMTRVTVPMGEGGPVTLLDSMGYYYTQWEYNEESWMKIIGHKSFRVLEQYYFKLTDQSVCIF